MIAHRYEIVRQKLDGSEREVFIGDDVDNCEGIAIDWMGEWRRLCSSAS